VTTLITAAVFVAVAGAVQAPQPQPGPDTAVDELWVEVAGRSVRALCTPGTPKVIFLHEAGGDAEGWRRVLDHLGHGIGACAYDRPAPAGEGSPPSARGWFELFEDLRATHEALGARNGYVVVGQGVGAMYARLFASARPGVVDGLLLVEPAHEDLPRLLRPAMSDADWTAWAARRAEPNPDGIREADLAERARRARAPRIPVTVITASDRPVPEGWNERFVDEAARQAGESLVRGRAFGRHVPARAFAPDIAHGQPALVADEIERLLRLTRERPD
jgi:pimeloyl-ACP methyl ester carboxylesterase